MCKDNKSPVEAAKEISEILGSHQLGKCHCIHCGKFVNITKLTMIGGHGTVTTDCKCEVSGNNFCIVCGKDEGGILQVHAECGHQLRTPTHSYTQPIPPIPNELQVFCPICGGPSNGPHPCTECYSNNDTIREQMKLSQSIHNTIMINHNCTVCGKPWTEDHPDGPCRLDSSIETVFCGVCFENKVDPKKDMFCSDCIDKHEPLRKLREIQKEITKFCIGCGGELGDDKDSHDVCHNKLIEAFSKM